MRYVDESRQELLVTSPRFPALIIAHQGLDSARFHWHPGMELLYARTGRLLVFTGNQSYTLHRGEYMLITPRSMHAVTMAVADDGDGGTVAENASVPQALSVTINPADMAAVYPQILQAQEHLAIDRANAERSDDIADQCERLFAALAGGDSTRFMAANAAFYALMDLIFVRYGTPEQDAIDGVEADDRTIAMVYQYVRGNYMGPLTTSRVARHFGYSREHFSRLFKKYTGSTFRDYLTEVRLLSVCDLLEATGMPVGKVGEVSGFPNEKSLRTFFARKFGCTPSEYRARSRRQGRYAWLDSDRPQADIADTSGTRDPSVD